MKAALLLEAIAEAEKIEVGDAGRAGGDPAARRRDGRAALAGCSAKARGARTALRQRIREDKVVALLAASR